MLTIKSSNPNFSNIQLGAPYFSQRGDGLPTKTSREGRNRSQRNQAHDAPLMWSLLAVIFLGLILAYPVAMAWMGDSFSVRYLLRLATTMGVVAVLAGLLGLGSFSWKR
jgi:hypothetical protein